MSEHGGTLDVPLTSGFVAGSLLLSSEERGLPSFVDPRQSLLLASCCAEIGFDGCRFLGSFFIGLLIAASVDDTSRFKPTSFALPPPVTAAAYAFCR